MLRNRSDRPLPILEALRPTFFDLWCFRTLLVVFEGVVDKRCDRHPPRNSFLKKKGRRNDPHVLFDPISNHKSKKVGRSASKSVKGASERFRNIISGSFKKKKSRIGATYHPKRKF